MYNCAYSLLRYFGHKNSYFCHIVCILSRANQLLVLLGSKSIMSWRIISKFYIYFFLKVFLKMIITLMIDYKNKSSYPWIWNAFGWMTSELNLASKFYTLWIWRNFKLFAKNCKRKVKKKLKMSWSRKHKARTQKKYMQSKKIFLLNSIKKWGYKP